MWRKHFWLASCLLLSSAILLATGFAYRNSGYAQYSAQRRSCCGNRGSRMNLSSLVEHGKASYYADKYHGKQTASGEIYDRNKLTAAHPTYPFGTICRITNFATGRSTIVRINDRGPFVRHRIIDISYRAAQQLGGIDAGVFDVKVEVLENRKPGYFSDLTE
ncbi:septal ring lytic transglycosylase RlpA family protein [candidate division KSB1 bacterium]|nr:septal ring lytic transglycosylase RlpA family protein [candidate division KSB1 bacterium]